MAMSHGSTPPNLDRLAAQRAQTIIRCTRDIKASDVENLITKALGVLQENGVYACFLYLKAKEKDNGDVVVEEMLNLLADLGFGWGKPTTNTAEDVLSHLTEKVTGNLERLLLAKETLEQMLIYARYGAKARS
jgi:hypothetical protein